MTSVRASTQDPLFDAIGACRLPGGRRSHNGTQGSTPLLRTRLLPRSDSMHKDGELPLRRTLGGTHGLATPGAAGENHSALGRKLDDVGLAHLLRTVGSGAVGRQ